MKQKSKKIISIFMLISMLFNIFVPLAQAATEMKSAYITTNTSYAPYYVNYNGRRTHAYFVTYNKDGKEYPAYCANYGLEGADLNNSYTVDIHDTYSNNRVWRALKNGYPYTSISSMGLKDKYEAYYVTKQAIYCALGQKDISLYSPISGYEYIYNSLVNLVNYVQNDTETYKDPTVILSKAGDVSRQTINGKAYYVQNYTVTSNLEFATFNVFISNFPEGTQIFSTDNIQKTEYTGTTKFKVAIPESNIKSEITGNIEIKNVEVKTYPILYGKTRVANTQDYIIATDVYETTGTKATLDFNANTCKIIVNKTDDDTNKPIQGVEFSLYNSSGTIVATSTTNSSGVANFLNLYPGKYILKETSATSNYVLNTSSYELDVKYNETKTVDITNTSKKGRIKVIKVDSENNEIKLKGVEFKIYDDKNNYIETIITDSKGEALSSNLRIEKTYKVVESKTLENYILDTNPKTVELKENEISEITFNNNIKKGKIEVIKVDSEYNEIPLEGVKFKIYDEEGYDIETLVTDAEGKATSSDLRIDKTYIVKEIETLDNYILSNETQTVKLRYNETCKLEFTNNHKKGNIKIYKIDADNNKIGLGNVEFKIYSCELKKIIGTYYTNVNGELYIENLRTGKYKLIETNTGSWYNLSNDVEIEIKYNQTEEIVIENELKKGSIKVIKVDSENNEIKLQGVKFEVLDTEGNTLETIVTDKNGEAYTSKYAIRDFQKLIVKEVQNLKNYKLDETPKTIILEADQIKTVTFNNEKIKGKIKIVKTSEDNNKINGNSIGDPIENVIFDIYDVNNKKVAQIKTNEQGIAISEELEKGTYYIKEKKPGKWYILNNKKYKVEIVNDEEIVELKITNKSENPNVDIEKTGTSETTPRKEITYNFKIRNTGNTSLSNFTWIDTVPTDYIKITKLITGTYNQDLNYSIYYKTNKNNYRLLEQNLNTQISTTIDLTNLQFEEDEYITEVKIYFETVDVGFESISMPSILANIKGDLLNGIFTNYVRVEGNNKGYIIWDEDSHTTIIHQEKLPKTGC